MSPSTVSSEIRIAVNALVLVERGLSEKAAITRASGKYPRPKIGRSEAQRMVIGTVADQDILDRIVQHALRDSMLRLEERCLARLTAWLCVKNGGVLRPEVLAALRELTSPTFRPNFEYLLGFLEAFDVNQLFDESGDVERVGLQTHHTGWWVDYCFHMLGRGEAVRLLSSLPRPRYVRVNSLRNGGRTTIPKSVGTLKGLLEPVESFPGIYTVSGFASSLSSLFSSGLFQYQDLASYAAVLAAEPKPGDSVLDMCSAPGTKTCALAQLMRNRGKIISVDYSRPRMAAWRTETSRLGVRIASPVIEDATRLGMAGMHDLVLVDPPCSGTGVFDRNPRMKWHLNRERVERYSQLQSRMLEEASRFLSPKGRMVYGTCSLTIEENEGVIASFLRAHPEMETRPIPLSRAWGSPGLNGLAACRRFYPHTDKTAGYFIARLENSK